VSEAEAPEGHLVVTTPWTSEHAAQYEVNGITSLGVKASLDLSFLETLPDLRRLVLVGASHGQDQGVVERCQGLEALTLSTDATTTLDLRHLPLKSLHAEWDRVPTAHLAQMPSLLELRWTNYPDRDLTAIAASRTLQRVQLDGVRRLRQALPQGASNTSIRLLNLTYGRGLVDLEGLQRFESLTHLSLQAVRPRDVSALGSLRRLTSLGLGRCGSLPDVEWLRGLAALQHLAIAETPVLSEDLSPLDDLPSIRTRYVQPRRGYNRTFTDTVEADDTEADDVEVFRDV
jgi:hypothetical protein